MKYTNHKPPEGINSGPNRPVREFLALGGSLTAIVAIVTVLIMQFGAWVAPFVPFSWERAMDAPFVKAFQGKGEPHPQMEAALQALADQVVGHMNLADDVTITLHYVDDKKVNAMASLGGHVFVFRGLLERLESQDALAMVLAHEIAHVKNRDVLAGLSGGVVINLASALLLGDAGAAGRVINTEVLLGTLHFSREKESRADLDALKAVVALYGHGGGAEDLFAVFSLLGEKSGRKRKTELMTSHPLTHRRIEELEQFAATMNWPMDGARTPLQDVLSTN